MDLGLAIVGAGAFDLHGVLWDGEAGRGEGEGRNRTAAVERCGVGEGGAGLVERVPDKRGIVGFVEDLRDRTTWWAAVWLSRLRRWAGPKLARVWDHWLKGTAVETKDPSLDCEAASESEVLKYIHIGLLCVQEDPADRPTMLDVLVMLHGQASSFAAPSKPAFAFARDEMMLSSTEERGHVSGGSGNQVEAAAAAADVFSVNEMSVSEFQPR